MFGPRADGYVAVPMDDPFSSSRDDEGYGGDPSFKAGDASGIGAHFSERYARFRGLISGSMEEICRSRVVPVSPTSMSSRVTATKSMGNMSSRLSRRASLLGGTSARGKGVAAAVRRGSGSYMGDALSSRRERKIDSEKKAHISVIRTTEVQDAQEMAEERMPELQRTAPTFNSAAHLRSDEYWAALLDGDGQDRQFWKWAEAKWFQAMIIAAIITNALLFGIANGPGTPVWQLYLKHGVLVFSCFELFVTLFRLRSGVPFRDAEERLFCAVDIGSVAGCLLEQWALPLVLLVVPVPLLDSSQRRNELGTITRVLWLARFLRVAYIVPALHELVRGVLQALTGLFWVFVFVFMMLYTLAVLCTAMIGHAQLDQYVGYDTTPTAESERVRELFSSVGSSMFLLFETMSSWSLMPLIPLFEAAPGTRLFFAAFYVYAGWTLLAVMTGTVSFTMIAIKAQIVGEDEVREDERRAHVHDVLQDIFNQLDEDGSGSLDYEEFKMILHSPDVLRLLQTSTNIKVQDLEDLWNWLDNDGSGEVTIGEFMQGFQWLNETFKPKTLMRLQEKIAKDISELRGSLEKLINDKFDGVLNHVHGPLRKIHAVTEQVQILSATMGSLTSSLEASPAVEPPMSPLPVHEALDGPVTELEALEGRLNAHIDGIIERIARFEVAPATSELRESVEHTSSTRTKPKIMGIFR